MRAIAIALCCVAIAGCQRGAPRAQRPATGTDVQTIDSAPPRPVLLDPPPVLTDEGPAPKPKVDVRSSDTPPPPTPQDEALRASLPFAPAIGLDPVDGSKISIRASTPITEYKNKIYYFSSEANKRAFLANPEQYMKTLRL
jgi:YHS domain-containing protein